MPCWDHSGKRSAIVGGPFCVLAQQAMIHGLFPLRGVPLKLPASLRSETVFRLCVFSYKREKMLKTRAR